MTDNWAENVHARLEEVATKAQNASETASYVVNNYSDDHVTSNLLQLQVEQLGNLVYAVTELTRVLTSMTLRV